MSEENNIVEQKIEEKVQVNETDINETKENKTTKENNGILYFIISLIPFLFPALFFGYIIYLILFHRDIFTGNFFNWVWIIYTKPLILILSFMGLSVCFAKSFAYGFMKTLMLFLFLFICYSFK